MLSSVSLGKMNGERIRSYILYRIHVAGGRQSIFSDKGLDALVSSFQSGSTPRVINSVCHWSLNRAFEKEKIMVDIDDVNEAVEGMGLPREVMSLEEREKEDSEEIGNADMKDEKLKKTEQIVPPLNLD